MINLKTAKVTKPKSRLSRLPTKAMKGDDNEGKGDDGDDNNKGGNDGDEKEPDTSGGDETTPPTTDNGEENNGSD